MSGGGPAWGRLYRWELLTFSLETLALATILAGAAQVRYRGHERIFYLRREMSNFAQYFAFSRKISKKHKTNVAKCQISRSISQTSCKISEVIFNSFREQF
jgi:hypothetical protein